MSKSETPHGSPGFAGVLPRSSRVAAIAQVALLGLGCTAIAPVSKQQPEKSEDTQAASQTAPSSKADPDAGAKVAVASAQCKDVGRVRCRELDGVERLICTESHWEAYEPCQEHERCDTSAGPSEGQCKSSASDCVGREPGAPFCVGTDQWVCTNDVAATKVSCPSHERCVTRNKLASCDCVPGAERDDSGECMIGSGCPAGACDAKTECSVVNGERSCSACPEGYSGDGLMGCAPLLIGLTASCGTRLMELTLSADAFDYQMTAPLTCQSVTITAQAPAGAQIEINGSALDPAASWSSPPLELGDNTLNITVTDGESGVNNAYRVTVQHTGNQAQVIRATNPQARDFFGYTLALDGDTLVVGAPWEDATPQNQAQGTVEDSGGAYVFVRRGGRWVEQAHLTPSALVEGEFFGAGVVVRADTIVVGAAGSDPSAFPPDRARYGSAYVFKRNGEAWSQIDKLTPSSPTGGDRFGWQMALSDDTLLVAAPYDSTVMNDAGAIYAFERAGETFRETQKLLPSRATVWTLMGSALALDGDTLVAGGCTDSTQAYDSGAVYVFTRHTGEWREQQILLGPSERDATFGYSVALLGETLVVGAPRAQRVPAGEMDAPLAAGEVFIFRRDGSQWVQTSKLQAPVPRRSDRFGSSLVLTDSLLAIGAMGDASAARGLQGDTNNDAAPGAGGVHLYARQGGEPARTTFLKSTETAAGVGLGAALAASQAALVVGAPYEAEAKSGAVFVFE